MKRKLSFLTLLLIFCSTMFGQHWTVNENTYNASMNVLAYVEIYGEPQTDVNLEMAAFCGNEVRGVANLKYNQFDDDYVVLMTIYGDTPNEIITFKLYDPSTGTGTEYATDYTLKYRLNGSVGVDDGPITIDFVEYYWEFVKDNETMPYSMTITSTASIDGNLLNRRNFEVAAFCGDELRGVGRQQKDGIIYFAIWGDGYETEDITFKLYDHSDGTLYERTDYSVPFGINNTYGDISNPVNINFTTRPYVAQIGDVKYISLAAAFEAAQDGDVVEILMAGTYELATSGKNITITGAVDGVVFDNIGAKNMGGANVTFNNVTFDYYPNVNYTGLQHSGNLVYNNCTINGQVFLYGTSETFSKCTFNQNSADAYNVWTYGAKEVAFNECTFNSVGKSVLIYNESESVTNDVTVTDCDFIASAPVDGKAAIEMDSSLQGEIKLTVDAATTATGFGTGNVSGNSLWNNKKGNETEANNDITVVVNGATVLAPLPLVAMTADDKDHRFTSLQAAYNNVAADGTITILNSVEGPGLVINKNVTIDFAGYTYAFNEGVGSTGTETNGLQILNGNTVVLKNGTLNVAETAKAKFYILVQNYANLTVDGMKLDGTNLDKYSGTDGDSYALSNNSGTVEIKGATEIIANNEGDKAFAFDVCKYANYAAPVVNVTGAEVKVNGAIEVHQDIPNNLNISAGTFTNEIEEAWCAEGYIPTQNTDGTWTVKAGKYVARIGEIGYETLAEAIAAIGAGDVVIELLDNVSLDYNAREAYGTAETTSVTINGNGKTLTLNQINSDWSSFGLKNAGAKVVFNDMTIEKTGYGDTSGAWNTHAIIFTSNVEMTDVTVNNSMAVQAGATLNNVTINEANGYYGLWINGNGQSVTMNGGAINATNGGRGIKVADQYVDSPALVTLNVTGTKFNTAKKAAVLVSSKAGANITASNVDITNVAEDNVNFVWVDEDWGPYYGKVTVTGGTLTQENLPVFVAALMNNAKVEGYYKVFEEALAAAEDEKILVLKTVVFDTDKTIDFGGKEVNSNVNPAFRITNGATVTVKNGNMNTAEGYNFILGASDSSSAGNLTIESGKFHGATTVASVTKGLLTITGGEFSVEPYQGNYAFLINCIDANYNNGAEVSISGGTFHKWNPENNAAEGANTNFCAPGHVAVYDAVNDTYTVIEANYVAKIGEVKYISLQAAVDACVVGDNTIEMLAEINEDVTIKQVEGVNVVIEGADNTFTGTFYIHGNARHDGAETLTFQNINFTTNEAGHYFIDSNSTASTERYAHNVTVKNCDFTATAAGVNSAAAMRIRQGFNIAINGGTFNDLHSVLQAYGNAGITVDGITVNGKNGISAGTSTGVVVKNSNITATGYGVRADGTGAYDVTIKGTTTINAAMPVVVRKTNDGNGYNLTIADGVTLTTTGSGYQVTFTAGDDGEYVAPTAGATANFGNNSYTTFGLVAKIENEYYTTVDYAAAYATTTEGTQTIVLIDDAAAATNPLNVEVIDLNGKTLTADVLGTVVTNGGLWTTAAAPGYKMLGVGAEIYATAGATVINSQTEVNIVEGDVTLVPAEWWTLQGQSLIIGEHASFTIPTGSKFNVMNNTDVTINGTAINNGTLAIHPEATVNGNVAGNLQFLGGSYVTAEDHKMVGTTDDYHYNTTDALVNIALNGDITIAAGTMTLGHDWRTLPNQTVTVASAAAFIVPSNMTYQIYGTAVVEDGGTLTVNGTIELASLTATLTAEDGLNVTLIDELQNQGYDVDYSNGTYSVIEGMIWNKTQDKKYNSLQAAIDASSEGDEIIVLKDIKYTQDDIITVDVYGYTTMVNATGKNVVLDLNGHLVEADVKDYSGTLLSIIFVGDDGSLTLKDSSVEKTGAVKAIGKEDQANVYALIIADTKNTTNIKLYIESGTYELNKCTVGGALVYVNISNILTVTGGNFYLGNAGTLTNNSPWIFNTHSNGINNVIVKGGNYNVSPIQHYGEVVIPVEFAVTQTSDVTYPYSVVPAVARIDQTGYASIADAVNEANDGDEIVVTVSHTATVPAVVERNLTLNLNGKAITGDVYPVVRVQNGANVTVTGNGSINNGDYVFVLGASDGSSEGDLTIENGMFVGETTVASVTKGLLTINGGEFSISETETYEYAYLINCIDANYNDGTATVSISGGTFHKWNPENNAAEGANTNFCADGYVAVYDAVNDTYTVIEANYVAQIGEVKYETLQAAINAAQNGDEIDVIDNISLEIEDADQLCDNQYKSFFNVNGKTITIDLNGYTVKAILGGDLAANAVSALVSTENESNLTIKDSSDEKTGTMWIDNVIEVYSLVFQYDNSIVTIESGNYKLNVCGNGRGMVYSNDDEKVTVNGGNFWLGNVGALSNGSPWIFNASGQNTRNIIVNGGTFNDDVLHQFYPFEVKAPKEKALQNNGDGTWTMVDAVAYVDEQHRSGNWYTNNVGFTTLEEAFAAAQTYNQDGNYVTTVTMLANVTAIAPIVVVDDVKFNMNTKAVTAQNIYPVIRIQNGASLTVTGEGSITNNDYVFVLGASDSSSAGNLTIESGVYTGTTTVASVTKGNLIITGGDFSVEPYEGSYAFLINCIDANYEDGLATVSISGGTFHNWNPENNAAEGANTNFCADGYGAVENPTDVWTVIPKQTMTAEVKKGWNWFSYYVEGDVLDQLQNSLGAAGVQIKSRTEFTQYSNGDWNGDLDSTTPAESYKINVNADAVINVTGNIVNPSECPIMLNNGGTVNGAWNWIGYPLAQETSVATAFAGVVKNGDEVKTRTGFAEYVNGQWWGSLMTLKPGVGYMYFRAGANETVSNFTYPTPSSKEAVQPNITADANLWVPNSTSYANNMTMVAVLNMNGEMMNDNYEVAAMVNGEVRGSARPIYVEPMDAYMLFLTIHGEGVEEVTFQCYDFNTDTEYVLNNTINYSDDARLGSVNEPYVLCYGTMGIGENSIDNINIYPNPTTTDREINLQATCDKVEVFNALGVKVAEYHNVDTLDAIETAGIYVIRVTNDGDVKHCRLVVK